MKASIFAAMLVAGVLSTPASAAQCGPKQIVAEQLGNRYGEVNFASGVAVGSTVKFFGNPRTGTWSMVTIKPDGTACVIAMGEGFEVIKFAFAEDASY